MLVWRLGEAAVNLDSEHALFCLLAYIAFTNIGLDRLPHPFRQNCGANTDRWLFHQNADPMLESRHLLLRSEGIQETAARDATRQALIEAMRTRGNPGISSSSSGNDDRQFFFWLNRSRKLTPWAKSISTILLGVWISRPYIFSCSL
jgi:hypothetical protein